MPIENTPTLELLARAIDATALRQGVYASNIAKAGVADYRRMEVHARAARRDTGRPRPSHRRSSRPTAVVKLDEEMARMAKNTLRYQMLLGAFERSMGTLRLAVREGRE